jgi:pSer/pThr/pTyr-binding forkhead associated (FHA) protein
LNHFGSLTIVSPPQQRQEFVLSKSEVTLGRAPTSDIVLNDNRASRTHARLLCGTTACVVEDLGSVNGVQVNGRPVKQVSLATGDQIVIGDTTLEYKAHQVEEEEEFSVLDDEHDLQTALHRATVMARVTETRQTRLAITTASRTWEVPLDSRDLSIGRLPENDIVIDSPSASRRHARIERVSGGYVLRDLGTANGTWVRGARVTYHHLRDMDAIRIGDAHLLFEMGYSETDLTMLAPVLNEKPRRPVVVIPGFFGSNLWLGEEKIWPNIRAMGRLPDLMKWSPETRDMLTPRGLIDQVVIVPNVVRQEQYGGLIDFLEEALGYKRGRDLFEFAYDFRQDLRSTARHLGEAIEGWRRSGQVTLIAHSMGTLISRYYVDRLGGHRQVDRMVLLGGPHAGSPKAVMNMAVPSTLLPFGVLGARIQEVMLTFPAIYHLLPEQPCGQDQFGKPVHWLRDESWLTPQFRPLLREAADFREEIRGPAKVPTLCIFGYGMKTLTDLRVTRDTGGVCTKIEGLFQPNGDGTVPEASAVIPGADIHPIQQYHGTLHIDSDVKKRLKVELTS